MSTKRVKTGTDKAKEKEPKPKCEGVINERKYSEERLDWEQLDLKEWDARGAFEALLNTLKRSYAPRCPAGCEFKVDLEMLDLERNGLRMSSRDGVIRRTRLVMLGWKITCDPKV